MHQSWDKIRTGTIPTHLINWIINVIKNIETIARAWRTRKLGLVGRGCLAAKAGEMSWWVLLGVLSVVVLVLYLFSLRRTYCIKGKHIVVRLSVGLSCCSRHESGTSCTGNTNQIHAVNLSLSADHGWQ